MTFKGISKSSVRESGFSQEPDVLSQKWQTVSYCGTESDSQSRPSQDDFQKLVARHIKPELDTPRVRHAVANYLHDFFSGVYGK